MRFALGVEVAHPRRGLADQFDRVLERQEIANVATAATQLIELFALDVLHGDVRQAIVFVDVVDVNDVGMTEQRADARLVEEHIDDAWILGELALEALDDDFFFEAGHRGLAREINFGHAAGGEAAHQFVTIAERHGALERGRRGTRTEIDAGRADRAHRFVRHSG